MIRILSIGNSFSQDSHKWLHKLAQKNGVDLETFNLFIGGCSLKMHWDNMRNNATAYDLEINGDSAERKISIIEALQLEKWDIITVQQVSGDSGIYETYEPYLSDLADKIKEKQPDAKIYFHQTWAYETDSTHGDFAKYNKDQTEMYSRIKKVSVMAAQTINAEIIPTGEVINTLRETVTEFDYKNGGLSLCRDGFHLSLDYGRYAAAATWLHTITGNKICATDFEDFELELLKKIVDVVNEF